MDSQDDKIRKTTTKVNTKLVVGQSGKVHLAYFLVVWYERIRLFFLALIYSIDPKLHFAYCTPTRKDGQAMRFLAFVCYLL